MIDLLAAILAVTWQLLGGIMLASFVGACFASYFLVRVYFFGLDDEDDEQ